MFPLKRFVQGPSLHEEQIVYDEGNGEGPRNTGTLNGEEASKIYEEIINLPSTSSLLSDATSAKKDTPSKSLSSTQSQSEHHKEKEVVKDRGPVPTLSRLMSYCETDNEVNLDEALNRFGHEIDINATDEYGWTLLMSASCAGSLRCVPLLLKNGASWEIKDKRGLTASDLARKNRHLRICDLIEEWNECYIELCQRKFQSSGNDNEESELDHPDSSNTPGPSQQFCEACGIPYKSSKDSHENSIAHLVCTAQFGDERIHYGIPESNKGFQLMVKSGWDKNRGLGPEGKGHKFPVKTVLKRNKLGLGNEKERKSARITHFGPFDPAAVETNPERLERENTVRKREAIKQKNKERRKEINYRRELSSL